MSLSTIEKLIAEFCPNGVEWKTLGEVAELKRGRVMSKEYLVENSGTYPVYSSQTANNGEIGKIATFDFDQETTLKKERMKLSDERVQNNAILRRISREETIKELGIEAANIVA